MNGIKLTPTVLATACAALLGACGGGDGGGQSPATTPTQPQQPTAAISGKAIDGYLAGATVCLDLNGNGACDTGEPTATTDAAGNFSIPFEGSAEGQRLLVQVSATTRDLSRPQGYQFPAGFTLSAVVGAGTAKHVTPLTTMVAAQMDAGMTEAEAIAAVRALLGLNVDPAADYVASGDTATGSAAAQIVDRITALASGGKADASRVRNVLNAMIAKHDIATVTQADVDAQATKPVYAAVDASKTLANPLYSFVDAFSTNLDGLTQGIQQIVDAKLQTTYQRRALGSTTWKELSTSEKTSYLEPLAQFVLKPDGNWTEMLTPSDWRTPVALTSIGKTLKAKDPATGIGITFEERSVDLSNQPATLAISGTMFAPNVSVYPALAMPFPADTTGYLGIKSFADDYVVLPMGLANPNCQFPYLVDGGCATTYATGPNLPPYDPTRPPYDPNVPQNDPKLPNPLSSVQQFVGLSLFDPVILGADIEILAGGQARIRIEFDPRTPADDKIINASWSVYPRKPNVMIFDISRSDAQILASVADTPWSLTQGAKFVLAIRNGQLHSGLLFPAGYGQRTIQFAGGLPSILTTPVSPTPALSRAGK